ncbi:MAG TPA: ribonuclease P protein component [Rhodanobacteraceae bacterium]|jgi:ribonuclease P protein component|nr:ribonuclease P protein component [Rhodanobacteraceae bacterium]
MARARFPHTARVVKPADFVRLRKNGQRIATPLFNAQATASLTGGARLGLAVSRRVSPDAVRRNRIKRIARESFRHARLGLPAVDILLIARETADAHDNAALRADLEMLWRRIASLNARPRPGTMRA